MDNPNVGLKMQKNKTKKVQLKVKVEVGVNSEITFLTQHLGLSMFDPNLGSNNPALFRESSPIKLSLLSLSFS